MLCAPDRQVADVEMPDANVEQRAHSPRADVFGGRARVELARELLGGHRQKRLQRRQRPRICAAIKEDAEDAWQAAQEIGLPVVVKPSKQGSTVGLSVVKKRADLASAVEEASKYDDEVMIEKFVPGRELTVGILGDVALPVGEIIPKHEIYDYECKYTAGMASEEFPAKLSKEATEKIQQQALLAFKALKLRGYARIDFRLTTEGEFYCLEANTLPGMTELSLIPQGAAAMGISFPELCERIVRLALR